MASDGDWVVIGKITKPFGLKGGLKIHPLTDDPGRFLELKSAVLEAPGGERQVCTVSDVRIDPKAVVLFCRELEKVDQTGRFIGGTVQVPLSEAVPLPENLYFQHDLLDLKVYMKDGRYVGEIKKIFPTGSNDVLVVRDGPREHLIPATQSVVAEVDIPGGRIILQDMDGLLDL